MFAAAWLAPRCHDLLTSSRQRIDAAFIAEIGRRVLGGRIRPFPLGEGALFGACSEEHARQAVVPFVTPGLVVDSIRSLVLPGQLLLNPPRPRPRRRVLDGDGVFDRVAVDSGPALHEMKVLAGGLKVEFR